MEGVVGMLKIGFGDSSGVCIENFILLSVVRVYRGFTLI